MMNQTRTLLSILACMVTIMLLSACGPSQAELDAAATQAASEEYATQTAEAPTATTTPTDTPIPTKTPLPPTYTPEPTDTPVPPTSTPVPTATPTPGPTLAPSAFLTLMELAEMYYQNGDYEMYIALQKELAGYQNEPTVLAMSYMLIANAYDELGDFETAISYYLKAYETNPATESVSNQLCWDYGLLGKADLALPYCEQAVKEEPAPRTHDSRGLAYALLGKFDAAIADFQVVVDDLQSSTQPDEQNIYKSRLAWLNALQTGNNPFTPQVLAGLRKDSASANALPTLTAEEKEPVSILTVQQAAQKLGFEEFTQPEESWKDFVYLKGSCLAILGFPNFLSNGDFGAAFSMEECSEDEQQGLAFWLVDQVYPDKGDKAKAFIWVLNDLYYVIEGEKTKTSEEIIGQQILSAEYDTAKKVLRINIYPR